MTLGLLLAACGGGDSADTGGLSQTQSGSGSSSGNHAPTLTGTPVTGVIPDTTYSFAPSAADVDGDTLVFSIVNKPAWASFNSSTGALTGTPTRSDVGTTTGVVIAVSDGKDIVTLDAFDLSVLGDGTVSWVAPTTRANGDPLQLSEIGGYRIYYGQTSDNLNQVIEINDPSVTEYVVDQLVPSNTYYFAVTAYDTEGIESALSTVVSKVVG